MIVEKVLDAESKNLRLSPCHTNRASQLGHPCKRYLVYMRTSWDKMALPPVERELIFRGGRMIEHLALRQLGDAGFNVSNQQRDFADSRYQISGHIDGFIEIDGKDIPIEIKGISPFEWEKIHTLDDMLKSKRVWVRGYPAQIQLYMFLANRDTAVFYLINKLTYMPKEIWCKLDYVYCEDLLKKAESINSYASGNQLPDKINDVDICKDCPAKAFCCPDIDYGTGIIEDSDGELKRQLELYFKLKPLANEFEKVGDNLKKLCKNRTPGEYLLDKYIISIDTQERTQYEIPAEIKSQYAVKKPIVITKFEEVES